MKKMKRFAALFMVFVLVLGMISGCSQKTSNGEEPNIAQEEDEEENGEKLVFQLSWAPAFDEKHGLTQAALQANEKIKELSNGTIEFKFFAGGQLGNEREVFESIQLGTIDSAFMSSPVLSGFTDVLNGFDMPYLCDNDMDLYQEIINSGIGEKFFEKMEKEVGVVGISYLINPGRDFYLNKEFKSLEDAKGVKLRSMESPIHLDTYKALGFSPTPLAYSEIYQAMKTGAIDGFEDVSVSVRSQKNYEVAKHVVISGHLTAAPVFIMSQKAWGKLNDEQKGWMKEAGIAAQNATKESYKVETEKTYEFMKEQGLTVTQIDLEAAKAAIQPVVEKYCEKSENIKEVVEYFDNYRKEHGK